MICGDDLDRIARDFEENRPIPTRDFEAVLAAARAVLRARTFAFSYGPHPTDAITVEYRGPDAWAVCIYGGRVLDTRSQWVEEASPSNRSDEFKATTRFPLDVALEVAQDAAVKERAENNMWLAYRAVVQGGRCLSIAATNAVLKEWGVKKGKRVAVRAAIVRGLLKVTDDGNLEVAVKP